jgi:hypothetical protein
MKLLNILWVPLFLLSAGLQYNDPDPYIWIPIYLYGAWQCYRAARKRFSPLLTLLGLSVYSSYAIYLFFDASGVLTWAQQHRAESLVTKMEDSRPWIEETREFFGLVILIAAFLLNWIWLGRRKPAGEVRLPVSSAVTAE